MCFRCMLNNALKNTALVDIMMTPSIAWPSISLNLDSHIDFLLDDSPGQLVRSILYSPERIAYQIDVFLRDLVSYLFLFQFKVI